MRAKSLVVWATLLVLALTFLSCSNPREVKIAVVGPMSGPEAKIGKDVLQGATLAVEEWNASGGVHRKKVVLISADDSDSPKKALEVAYSITSKRPLIVIGHVDSSCSLAASRIYQERHVVMISPASTTPALTRQGFDNVHRVCGRDDRQGRAAAVWCLKNNMGDKVVVIHDDSDYGRGLADQFKQNYEFLSNRKVALDEEVKRGDQTMAQVAEKIKTAPDLVYFGGLYQQGAALLRHLRQAGITAAFMSGDGCFDEEFITMAGPEVASGALFTFYPDLAAMPGTKAKEFAANYEKRFRASPGPLSIFGYTAANVGLMAASKAVTPLSDRTVGEAIHRLTFETPFGLMQINDSGDPAGFIYSVWRVRDGKFEEVGS